MTPSKKDASKQSGPKQETGPKKQAAPKQAGPKQQAAPKQAEEEQPKPEAEAKEPPAQPQSQQPQAGPKPEVAPRQPKEGQKERKEAPKRESGAPAQAPAAAAAPRTKPSRLKERYRKDIVPKLRDRFHYRNVMEVPRLEKVVINVRVGDATTDTRFVDKAVEELTQIAGQRPAVARARKSIANFKLRRGQPIATHVTLRGDRMYDFVDKLFSAALPRIKDFKGISERQFDGRGNLNIGMREQLIFPEIDYDKVEKIRGMDITLVTTAKSDEEGRELLKLLGLPLREAAPGEAGAPVAAAR